MGFDLYMLQEPKHGDGYWRGLGGLVEAMTAADVLDTETEQPVVDATWPPAGVDEELAEEIFEHLRDGEPLDETPTEAEMQACRDYYAAYECWSQTRSPFPDKVPAYKYDANEGMHVVPEECALIADALERLLEDPPEDLAERCDWDDEDALLEWIEDWMDYNRLAAKHGGYRVR